jgi:hypothetical protein
MKTMMILKTTSTRTNQSPNTLLLTRRRRRPKRARKKEPRSTQTRRTERTLSKVTALTFRNFRKQNKPKKIIADSDLLIKEKNEYGDYKVTKLNIKMLEVKEKHLEMNKSVR